MTIPGQAGSQEQDVTAEPPTLPIELLIEIAKQCVEPWTLAIDHHRSAGFLNLTRPVLTGFPNITNAQLANKLFRDVIRNEMIRRFDGCITIKQSIIDLAEDLFEAPQGRMPWLARHVTKLTIQNDLYFTGDNIGLNIRTLPKLKVLIFELNTIHLVDFGGRTLDQVLNDPQEHPNAVIIVFRRLHDLLIGYNRWLVRALLRNHVKVHIKLHIRGSGWLSAVTMSWKLRNATPGFAVKYRGASLDDGST